MKKTSLVLNSSVALCVLIAAASCRRPNENSVDRGQVGDSVEDAESKSLSAQDILGNPNHLAFCYGGYRGKTRDDVPTIDQLKDDLRILSAMGVKLLRTYNTQQFDHASNLLTAIEQLRQENANFEMYVMLGAWIECEGAWTPEANHEAEHLELNTAEIKAAVRLANEHPDIVKVIAVGNEAMVHWATTYFVRPAVIHKWVVHLQQLKSAGELPTEIWITSSDNFASWGGGDSSYHTDDLKKLIESVDYVSLHTYPFHDTHYNPEFWLAPDEETNLTTIERADSAMRRAKDYAVSQYHDTADYIQSIGIDKSIHIGETGWASIANSLYGPTGSQAADEYKSALYYKLMRQWSREQGIACFYFEAFDEQWKDPNDAGGSENHFGLFTLQGRAKHALWDDVESGVFDGLSRDGNSITKTFEGDNSKLRSSVLEVPLKRASTTREITTVNDHGE